jgi:hypothetical protein
MQADKAFNIILTNIDDKILQLQEALADGRVES